MRWASDGVAGPAGPAAPVTFTFPWHGHGHGHGHAPETPAPAPPPMPLALAVEIMQAAGFFADHARHEIARTHEILAPRLALRRALRMACEVGHAPQSV